MYWVIAALGILTMASPEIFGYASNPFALWSSFAVGFALIATALFEALALHRETWEYWVAVAVGLLSVSAPFVLGFSTEVEAVWTLVTVGIITIVLSSSQIKFR